MAGTFPQKSVRLWMATTLSLVVFKSKCLPYMKITKSIFRRDHSHGFNEKVTVTILNSSDSRNVIPEIFSLKGLWLQKLTILLCLNYLALEMERGNFEIRKWNVITWEKLADSCFSNIRWWHLGFVSRNDREAILENCVEFGFEHLKKKPKRSGDSYLEFDFFDMSTSKISLPRTGISHGELLLWIWPPENSLKFREL